MSDDFKDFIFSCLQVDGDRRKSSESLLHHPLFHDVKSDIDKILDTNLYFVSPIGTEAFNNLGCSSDDQKIKSATCEDNYEIFINIMKVDLILFLKKKGIINYKPKILDIPQYFSLNFPESEDYSIGDYENELNLIKKVKKKQMKMTELIFDRELNERLFNEGSLITIGYFLIKLPKDYEKEIFILDNFLKDNFVDIQVQNLETNSYISDNSSEQSRLSISKNAEIKSQAKSINSNIEKDISNYFKIKNIMFKILYKIENFKRDDLIIELKKTNYFIPNNLRYLIYCIILDVDYIVQSEEYEIANYYENKEFIVNEMKQVKKDIIRCEEYDLIYKTDEGKFYLKNLFEACLYNKEDFFYIQGMDSIAAAFIKLYYPFQEIYFQVFYKFIKKLTYNFLDLSNKSIKNLDFNHLIISRILAFIEPELYVYLESINFFDDLYASSWLITLFSSNI